MRSRQRAYDLGGCVLALVAIPVVLVALAVAHIWSAVHGWIARRVYDFGAPIRRVRGPFVLVLRSFQDGMAYVDLQWTRTSDEGAAASPQVLSSDVFGGLLASCDRETFFGIGDGRRVENLFLLNVPVEHWFAAFTILAKHAKAILVLPENTASLRREVEHVFQEHTAKVTVLMPPSRPGVHEHTTDGTFVYTRHEMEREPGWETARIAFDSVGVKLPAYHPSGAFLRAGLDGELTAARLPWSGSSLAQLLRESRSCGDAQAALRELRSAGIPLVSIPGHDRLSDKDPGNLTPPTSSEEPVEDLDRLSPFELEKRRQQAALRAILRQLSPTASGPRRTDESTPKTPQTAESKDDSALT